ncbi:hypothetical protein Ddye_026164 [Dipteronia dyeriana]|uniref:Retrotransposon gag domain-containing protein n=1 Tax=Dipteronia dyeriana TaxID=168575 RepID=A0AAD9WNW1_9ROSI|nr:hypothetical protein Ddye_026164 [Dipteronia dyeriana]
MESVHLLLVTEGITPQPAEPSTREDPNILRAGHLPSTDGSPKCNLGSRVQNVSNTLTDYPKKWFRMLHVSNVDLFTKLSSDFCSIFQGIQPFSKDPFHLQYESQKRGEKLKSYMERFHNEVIHIRVITEKETLANF